MEPGFSPAFHPTGTAQTPIVVPSQNPFIFRSLTVSITVSEQTSPYSTTVLFGPLLRTRGGQRSPSFERPPCNWAYLALLPSLSPLGTSFLPLYQPGAEGVAGSFSGELGFKWYNFCM